MTDRDPIQALWKSQAPSVDTKPLPHIQSRAQRFQTTVRVRNAMEYCAALFVIVFFGRALIGTDSLMMKIGAALIIIATLFVCYTLYNIAQSAASSTIDKSVNTVEFHRQELRRQHHALTNVWKWYLSPFVPGMVLFVLGSNASAASSHSSWSILVASSGSLLIIALVFVAIHWLNRRAANKIRQELAELETWEQRSIR